MKRPDESDVKQVRGFHYPIQGYSLGKAGRQDFCNICHIPWPCISERLATRIELLESALRFYQAENNYWGAVDIGDSLIYRDFGHIAKAALKGEA